MMPSWSQISGGLDRLILMFLTFAVAKHWIATEDVAPYAALVLGVAGAVYGFWNNRATSIIKSADELTGPDGPIRNVVLKNTVDNQTLADSLGPHVDVPTSQNMGTPIKQTKQS